MILMALLLLVSQSFYLSCTIINFYKAGFKLSIIINREYNKALL